MSKPDKLKKLTQLFREHFQEEPIAMEVVASHASVRLYYKITSENHQVLGTVGPNPEENRAFIALSHHLGSVDLSVPKVLVCDDDQDCYIQEYVSDQDLRQFLQKADSGLAWPILRQVMDTLVDFQVRAHKGWDYDQSYPHAAFDENEIIRDVKRLFDFVIVGNLPITLEDLRVDQENLIAQVSKIAPDQQVLIHRDFQNRNILIRDDKVVLIDFQGARRGPLHYDLVSFLYDPDAGLDKDTQTSLLNYFISKKGNLGEDFDKNFRIVAVARLVQVMGSYGVAIQQHNKQDFVPKLKQAAVNLQENLSHLRQDFDIDFPCLDQVAKLIINA